MRMQVGDQIIVCDGKGGCMEGVIRSAKAKEGMLELTKDHSLAFRNPRAYKVSLGMAPTKSIDRTEFAIEKLIEIGVEEIAFLDCDHNERTYLRLDRLQKISIAASKQSKKTVFPSLQDLVSAEDYVDRKSHLQNTQIFACHLDEDNETLLKNYLPGHDVVLLIGPEGGFSSDEIETMKSQNVKLINLGPFRLRVETAAIVACAQIHFINQMPKA